MFPDGTPAREEDPPEEAEYYQERRARRAVLGCVLIFTGLLTVFAPLGDPGTQKAVGIPLITFGALIIDPKLARSLLHLPGKGHE